MQKWFRHQRKAISLIIIIAIIVSGIIIIVIINTPLLRHADSVNPGVFSKYSAPYGIPYKVWITRWWQWHISIPKEDHPWKDPTGEKCAVGQEGPVWFLNYPPGKVELICTMPAGKAILFPILSAECDYGTEKTDAQVRKCATQGNEYGVISAIIDGARLQNLERYRIQSDFFNITIPEDNIYDADPGTFRAWVDGFFVFLEPLPPGRHNIHFTVSVSNPTNPELDHAKDTTYQLIVKP